MKKFLFVFVLGSFMGLALTANACDGHKAKTSKASTEVAKTPVTTASTAVAKDAKKADCTPAEKAACMEKASKASTKAGCDDGMKTTSTDATGAGKSCCAKKTTTKKS